MSMGLTRAFENTVQARSPRDRKYRRELLREDVLARSAAGLVAIRLAEHPPEDNGCGPPVSVHGRRAGAAVAAVRADAVGSDT